MKALLILGLALLLAAGVWWTGKRTAGPGTDFAQKLYQQGLLNAAGRDELLRRMRANELNYEHRDPLTHSSQEIRGTNRASVLNFCAEAFQTEFIYRLPMPDLEASDLYIAGQAPDPGKQAAMQKKLAQELKQFGGDTNAWLRHRFAQQPARVRIEDAIAAEDSLPRGGWTIYPPMSSSGGRPGLYHWISERRSVWGKTRTRTARDLLAVGLLDETAYQQLQKAMEQSFMQESGVCQLAATLMQRRQTYAQDLARQQQWLLQLQRAKLLTAAQRQHLAHDTPPYQLKSLFEVIGYCEHGRIVDLRALPPAPQTLYPLLFRQVQALLPDFQYTDLRVTLKLEDHGFDLLDQAVTLRFRADGRQYENTFTHDYRRRDGTDPNPDATPGPSETFHASINQWLADRHSPLRLYQARTHDYQSYTHDANSMLGNERLGLLLMTQHQRALWGEGPSLFSQESHDNRFNSASIEQLLAGYQQLGLFAHLSAAELARGRAKAFSGQKTRYAEVLLSFPHLLYVSDGETANPPYPYAAFTKELAAMSRGGFVPTRVHDGFGEDYPSTSTVPFGFTLGRKAYRTQLPVRSDWMATEATELINRALQEQRAPGKFYECLNGEGLIFLTPPQYAALSSAQPELFKTPQEAAALAAPAD